MFRKYCLLSFEQILQICKKYKQKTDSAKPPVQGQISHFLPEYSQANRHRKTS
jgi:hypothetical protein